MKKLGKIEKIKDIREIWKNEASNFTPWLAEQENLDILAKEIGISQISLINVEENVGNFSADIFAEDDNEEKIIIENQYGKTDHDHLGKIITYASGKDAKKIIWIVETTREEHRSAIDWLNNHTDEEINFFLVKIEVWQIGNSLPAPKFEIIAKPNNWKKVFKKDDSGKKSELVQQQIQFTESFFKFYKEKGSSILRLPNNANYETPTSQTISNQQNNWFSIIMKPRMYRGQGVVVSARFPSSVGDIAKKVFIKLRDENKEEIEKEFEEELFWNEHPKGANIEIIYKDFRVEDENRHEEYFEWIRDKAEKLTEVLKKYSDAWTIAEVRDWED